MLAPSRKPDKNALGPLDSVGSASERCACASAPEGRVTLVGAGPGDPELLTLKAVRALRAADVVLFDALVSDEILDVARHDAKRMLVGKRGGRKSCRQDDINDLMIKLARLGKHVVRLKSGDPMVFGRAGEELARLEAERIPVTVVPGISAAIAMASELGVSLTHRNSAHSVRFVTGHSRSGALPDDIDWAGLADPDTTLIFYMGGRTAHQIAGRLISEGQAPGTPVVIKTSVSRPDTTTQLTTLAGLFAGDVTVDVSVPVLLGIGSVFAALQQSGICDRSQDAAGPNAAIHPPDATSIGELLRAQVSHVVA